VSGDVPATVALSDDDGAVDTAALSAAEPVVTETMAELYLQQGHREDALRVFHALLAQRPGDARLAARLRELEAPSAKAPPLESATAFLRRVWRGEPAPRAAPAHELSGALEAAFAAVTQTAHAAPVEESPGAPTHPAADSISLDSVFGDQLGRAPGAEPPTPPAAPQAAAPGAPGGFSFDDFFGATPNAAGGAGSAARSSRNSGPRPRSPQPEDEDLDQFQAWLKGLKA
jgi:hypothetical protein